MTEPILVELIGGARFCVFSAHDAATLRIAHRICGEYLGVSHSTTLASSTAQTDSKATAGLPMCLSAIEALFAYTQGWIKIVQRTPKVAACRNQSDSDTAQLSPAHETSAAYLRRWTAELSVDFDKQIHEQEDRRAAALLRVGKSGSCALPTASHQGSNSENSSEPALKRPKLAAAPPVVTDKSILNLPLGSYVRLAAEQHPNNAALHRQLQFTPSGVLAEIEDDSFVIEEVPLRQWITLLWSDQIPSSAPVALEHPQVELALHRAAVYADLWHRGYYITAARKFGSDFLVYPRPQHQCHAACLVLVRPRNCPDSNTKESDHGGRVPKMTALDLASLTRLASSVKKSLVIASVSPPAGSSFLDRLVAASGQELKQCWADIKPSYLTIDWMQRETTIPSAIRAM